MPVPAPVTTATRLWGFIGVSLGHAAASTGRRRALMVLQAARGAATTRSNERALESSGLGEGVVWRASPGSTARVGAGRSARLSRSEVRMLLAVLALAVAGPSASPVVVLVSANAEWKVVRQAIPAAVTSPSPFGEFFSHRVTAGPPPRPIVLFPGGSGESSPPPPPPNTPP